MCIRCASRVAHEDALCPLCSFATRIEAARGLRRLSEYLGNWAAFEEWVRRREGSDVFAGFA